MPSLALVAREIVKSYSGYTVLDKIAITASAGQRVGVVGENGVGKSTLLRLLAGLETPDAGSIEVPDDTAHLPQEATFDRAATVGSTMAVALARLHDLVRDVEGLSAELAGRQPQPEAYARALERADDVDAWNADRRAALALEGLGLSHLASDRGVSTLSGGQRSRLVMALTVTARPDCVLLDEPTNHLDDAAMALVEDFLLDLPGIVVVVSHDRVFLDRVCTQIVDLDPNPLGNDGLGGHSYGGGFSAYLEFKAAARRRWEQTYLEQQQAISVLRHATAIGTTSIAHNRGPTDNDKFVHKFKGQKVDRALSRRLRRSELQLAIAEREQLRKPRPALRFDGSLTVAPISAQMAVSIRGLEVRGRVRVPRLDIRPGTRVLVTGPNGSGKSTLLALIAGRLTPDAGAVDVRARRVGFLAQEVVFDEPDTSARRVFAGAVGAALADRLETSGLLHRRDLDLPVGDLSVGQRRRLALAIEIARAPDLLLLDEPTNHLSLALATELEEALRISPGTVVIATHDRWLRRHWDGPQHPLTPPPHLPPTLVDQAKL